MTRERSPARDLLVGTAGGERAVAWSIAVLVVVWVGLPELRVAGVDDLGLATAALAAAATVVAAVHAYHYRGALACVVWVFAPLVAAFDRTIDPLYLDGFAARIEVAGVAAAAAFALGIGGYAAGRLARFAIGTADGGPTPTE